MDWFNQPSVFKHYEGLEAVDLPWRDSWRDQALSRILSSSPQTGPTPTLEDLSLILHIAYGITAKTRHGGDEFHYRSAPSAGALYPCEIYIAGSGIAALEDGLYHYNVARHALTRLRAMDVVNLLNQILSAPGERCPQLTFFITAIFYRSSWKYGERAYRYVLLDAGHLLENLLLAVKMTCGACFVDLDFDDEAANAFLGVDPSREACLAISGAGQEGSVWPKQQVQQPLASIQPEASRVAVADRVDPLIVDLHLATVQDRRPIHDRMPEAGTPIGEKLIEQKEGDGIFSDHLSAKVREWISLDTRTTETDNIGLFSIIRKRRSRRNFVNRAIDRQDWQTILSHLCEVMPQQPRQRTMTYDQAVSIVFFSANLDGLETGFYLLDRNKKRIGLIRKGDRRNQMAHACLGQMWLARAALQFVFLSPLEDLERHFGPRAYRYGLIQAGRLGERIYLGATGRRLGVCGIGAFFDQEAGVLLDLDENWIMSYLVAVGTVKRSI